MTLSQALNTNNLIFFPQDISHLLASTFGDLYTGDVIGVDVETNWIKSQGGDSVYHESFLEELQKVQVETKSELGALFSFHCYFVISKSSVK